MSKLTFSKFCDARKYQVQKKKEIQEKILRFLDEDNEDEGNNEKQFQDLLQYFKISTLYHDYIGSRKAILILINCIANNHYRTPKFFQKIEKLLIEIQGPIKENISSNDIYFSFKNNKRILLFLIQNKILEVDQQFVDRILYDRLKNRHYQSGLAEFLFPEIRPFLRKKDYKSITGNIYFIEQINVQEEANIPLFEEKRSKYENVRKICELIRDDSVDKFVEYVSKNCIQLNGYVQRSIFETNLLLNKKEGATLIEYAAFFGSLQIVNFLRMSGVKIKRSLMKFAIHSNNADIIHLIEDFADKEDISDEDFYQSSFDETLKCHNFNLSQYFMSNFISNPVLDKSVKWLNFEYFPTTINEVVFYYVGENDLCDIFDDSNLKFSFDSRQSANRMNNKTRAKIRKGFSFISGYQDSTQVEPLSYSNSIVGRYNLRNQPYVTKFVISGNAKEFVPNIFTNCPHMEEIVFQKPASLVSLNNGAFYGRSFLKQIEIPASVRKIGNFAFGKCVELRKITFEEDSSLETIGKCCFMQCSALEEIVIPSSVKKIGKNIFEKCASLMHASIPSFLQNEVTKEYLNSPEQTKIDYY